MQRSEAIENSEIRGELLDEILNATGVLSVEALVPIPGLIRELGASADHPATPNTVRRFIGRLRVLRRYAELRGDPANAKLSDAAIIRQVARDASAIAPGLNASVRAVRLWITKHNRVNSTGLAGGWNALIDRYGRARTIRATPRSRKRIERKTRE